MKQAQTIDDILKMLKDSVNDEHMTNQEAEVSQSFSANSDVFEMSEETLKEQLQKQYGDSATKPMETENDPYAIDQDFLQQACEEEVETESEMQGEDNLIVTEQTESIEKAEKLKEVTEETEVIEEKIEEKIEEIEAEEKITCESIAAVDYSFEEEEEEMIFYEILPKSTEEREEENTSLVLRTQPTDPVSVSNVWTCETEVYSESNRDKIELISGNTYTTPALTSSSQSQSVSEYELLRQLGCEEEWKEDVPSEEEPKTASGELSEYESYHQTSTVLAFYQKKKIQAICRLIGVTLGAILLLIYETLPFFGVPFGGMLDYQEYIGSYLLFGFQILLICVVILWKGIAKGARRLFTLHPNLYSLAVLSVICIGIYDIVVIFTLQEWVAPFHASAAILLVLLAFGEYLMLSREKKAFWVFCTDPERKKYTLHYQKEENSCVAKMRRGGLSVDSKIAAPESCEFPHGFFRSIREDVFDSKIVEVLLIPCLLLSLISAVVTMLLNWALSVTILTAISALMATLPLGATLAACLPLWISANRLGQRQIALMGTSKINEIADVDVLLFEDFHLFRPCHTTDTGIAIFEKNQTAAVLGCLACLYDTIGGPLAEAFANVPAQYRFENICIRRLVKGGVEALVERKHVLLVGDAAFMKRYGLVFPQREEKAGRMTVYISLDGKLSAKMSVCYQTEPIFEMLAERLARENIQCVIKTFDPMISAAQISSLRNFGDAPISVVHQGVSDIKTSAEQETKKDCDETAVLAVASRFKIAEAIVWSKALLRIRRINHGIVGTFTILGFILLGLLIGFAQMDRINQCWFILWGALANICIVVFTCMLIPTKKYFSVDACREEWQKQQKKKQQKGKSGKKGKKST